MTLLHRIAHWLGWNLGYVDHYRAPDGCLFIGHICGTCREPNRLTAVHSINCECLRSPHPRGTER